MSFSEKNITYAYFKPDKDNQFTPSIDLIDNLALKNKSYENRFEAAKEILEKNNLQVIYKSELNLTPEMVKDIYKNELGKAFYPDLERALCSDTGILVLIQGEENIETTIKNLSDLKKIPMEQLKETFDKRRDGKLRQLREHLLKISQPVQKHHDSIILIENSYNEYKLKKGFSNELSQEDFFISPDPKKPKYTKIKKEIDGQEKDLLIRNLEIKDHELISLPHHYQQDVFPENIKDYNIYDQKDFPQGTSSYNLTKIFCLTNIVHTPDSPEESESNINVLLNEEQKNFLLSNL